MYPAGTTAVLAATDRVTDARGCCVLVVGVVVVFGEGRWIDAARPQEQRRFPAVVSAASGGGRIAGRLNSLRRVGVFQTGGCYADPYVSPLYTSWLVAVVFTDLHVRLVASGVVTDPRLL